MTDTTAAVLRLSGITKRFGKLVANDAISLTLARGEVLALLGENGAGKTTLMSILFGHYMADEGSIEVFGKPLPHSHPAVRQGLCYVNPQERKPQAQRDWLDLLQGRAHNVHKVDVCALSFL